jgi:hypothetical protein
MCEVRIDGGVTELCPIRRPAVDGHEGRFFNSPANSDTPCKEDKRLL